MADDLPSTPVESFMLAVHRLETGQALGDALSRWLAAAFRAFANDEYKSLEQALGLSVMQGYAHKRLGRVWRQAVRDQLIHELCHNLQQSPHGRHATKIGLSHLIAAGLRDEACTVAWSEVCQAIIEKLRRDFPRCPKSAKQIERILDKETTAQKLDIKATLFV